MLCSRWLPIPEIEPGCRAWGISPKVHYKDAHKNNTCVILGPVACYLKDYFFGGTVMGALEQLKKLLGEALQIDADSFDASTQLLGAIPEFDSMAVVTVITAIEEQFSITVEDDEISAEIFETIGSLEAFVQSKLSG